MLSNYNKYNFHVTQSEYIFWHNMFANYEVGFELLENYAFL